MREPPRENPRLASSAILRYERCQSLCLLCCTQERAHAYRLRLTCSSPQSADVFECDRRERGKCTPPRDRAGTSASASSSEDECPCLWVDAPHMIPFPWADPSFELLWPQHKPSRALRETSPQTRRFRHPFNIIIFLSFALGHSPPSSISSWTMSYSSQISMDFAVSHGPGPTFERRGHED